MRSFLIGISFLLFVQTSAQHTKVFLDKSENKQGQATYYGSWNDSILPKSGYFTFNWRALDSHFIYTYTTKGYLKNHQPNNFWEWQQAKLNYSINPGKGIQPVFKTNGIVAKWKGYFNEGVPRNNWTFTIDSLDENGKIVEKMIEVKMPFTDGKVVGNFTVEDKREASYFKLSGKTNKQGEAVGVWNYEFYKDSSDLITEKHTFKSGVLLEVLIEESDSQWVAWDKNAWFFEEDSTINIDSKIGDSIFLNSEYEGIFNDSWDDLMKNKFLSGWDIDSFYFENPFKLPIFRRIEYPLSDKEKEWIEKTKELTASTTQQIENSLEGESLIKRSRSVNLDLSISYLEQTKMRMNLVDSLLERTTLPYFTYKNRHQKGNLKYVETINNLAEAKPEVYDTSSLFLPVISTQKDSFQLFKSVYELTELTAKSIQEHLEMIEQETIFLEKLSERNSLEEVLSAKLDSLKNIFKNEEGIGKTIFDKWIESDLQQKIIRYAQKDNHNKAMKLGNAILERMDTIANWEEDVEVFDNMIDEIKNEYTRLVFNPYTGNKDLEMVVKRRFLNTITTIFWPWLESKVYEAEDWKEFNELWNQQYEVYNFVMVFANREDKVAQKINKRVRKEDNPERILRLLN